MTLTLVAAAASLATVDAPTAGAKSGDTHIIAVATRQTIDCGGGTLFLNGSDNVVIALGSCRAVTVQGSGHTVIADNVENDVTVYGSGNTVLYKGGNPVVVDRGRELGMTNRIDRVPA